LTQKKLGSDCNYLSLHALLKAFYAAANVLGLRYRHWFAAYHGNHGILEPGFFYFFCGINVVVNGP
jgi:hypothetical protein